MTLPNILRKTPQAEKGTSFLTITQSIEVGGSGWDITWGVAWDRV